jgi:hypothetical protein
MIQILQKQRPAAFLYHVCIICIARRVFVSCVYHFLYHLCIIFVSCVYHLYLPGEICIMCVSPGDVCIMCVSFLYHLYPVVSGLYQKIPPKRGPIWACILALRKIAPSGDPVSASGWPAGLRGVLPLPTGHPVKLH